MIFVAIISFALVSKAYSDCRNPDGRSCGWYKSCLERYKPCGANGYAIKYADHFCRRYDTNYNKFSTYGKRWVSAVKNCLQKELAPYLSKSISCSKLKQAAFESHVPCYVDPTGTGSPTYCKLSTWDHVQVLNTIKGAFLTELKATVGGGWDTAVACLNKGKK